jgi:hypothetical protein
MTEKVLVNGTERKQDRPDPDWLCDYPCPLCNGDVVSNCYYVGGKGYVIAHECWAGLGPQPTCNWRKVL